MIARVEDYVKAYYHYLDLSWPPQDEHLARVVALYGDRLEVLRGPVTCCIHDRNRDFSTIYVAEGLVGVDFAVALGEEFSHALFTLGMALAVRKSNPHCPRMRRLARICEMKDEAVTRSFLQAWFLPTDVVLDYYYRPRQLERATGCPEKWVRQRRQELWPVVSGMIDRRDIDPWRGYE